MTFFRGQDAGVVAVAVRHLLDDGALRIGSGRHPVGGDVPAFVRVLDDRRAARLILGVGQPTDQHAAGQGVEAVRPDHAPRRLDEVVDRLHEPWLSGIGVNVEDEDLAGVEAARPQITPVIREVGVMRLVAAAHRDRVNHLPERG